MQLPIHIDENATEGLQIQVFDQVRRLIVDGRLKPGAPMPASRVLAGDLNISRNTVVLAYERLESEGYLEVRQPTGTFVSSNIIPDCPQMPQAEADDARQPMPAQFRKRLVFRGKPHVVVSPYDQSVPYDFWVGRPDARLFPARTWQRMVNSGRRQMQVGISSYGEPAGLAALRRAIADYVGAARGVRADADQVLVTNGIQEGLNILARLFVQPGTAVAVENPCYCGAANVFASHGATLVPVPVDADGADVARLPDEAALIYVTPSHQYPTGATLSMARRGPLLDWARHVHGYIVEDDYDCDFYYDSAPLPALQSLDEGEHVIYLGTFSKSLAPGLRTGYMILPRHLADTAITVKALLNNCSPLLSQVLLAEFVASGAFIHHLRRIRTSYRARRDCLVNALGNHFGDVQLGGTGGGMHFAWQLPEEFPTALELERRCRDEGVGIYSVDTGNAHVFNGARRRHARTLMLGYAALDEDEIAEGVRRIATVLA